MFAVEGVDESAGIPRDLNHHSGHCPSLPPPGQKQLSMILLVKALDDDQLIHIRELETEPTRMWERLKTVHEKTAQLQTFGPGSTLLCTLILLFHFELTFP